MKNLGKISIFFAAIAAIFILFGFVIIFVATGNINTNPLAVKLTGWMGLFSIILAIIAIVIGAIARLGKEKDKLGLYAVLIGICCFLGFGLLEFASFLKFAL
jgi:uncharacterized membrane protein